jgi:ABC-type multidrug transport system fused ATPase/permease subunit
MVEIVKSIQQMLNPNILLENVYLFAVLSVFLVMYGPRLHMALPPSVRNLFNTMGFRAFILFLVAYISHRSFSAAIVIAIVYVVTINMLHHIETFEAIQEIKNKVAGETFTNYGPAVATCSNYSNQQLEKTGSYWYPLHDSNDIDASVDPSLGYEPINANF